MMLHKKLEKILNFKVFDGTISDHTDFFLNLNMSCTSRVDKEVVRPNPDDIENRCDKLLQKDIDNVKEQMAQSFIKAIIKELKDANLI